MKITNRELEVLYCLMLGIFTHRAIGLTLGISPHTVKRHIAELMNETGAGTKLELILWGFYQGKRQSKQYQFKFGNEAKT
jgi:DNA-binding CsgD family transcriptional regulator